MSKAREVKRRIRSVDNTRQITRTMEMVATSKLKKATDRVYAARPYGDVLEEVMRTVTGRNVRAVWSKVKFISPVFPGERVDVHLDPLTGAVRFECRVSERVVAMGTFERMMDKMA